MKDEGASPLIMYCKPSLCTKPFCDLTQREIKGESIVFHWLALTLSSNVFVTEGVALNKDKLIVEILIWMSCVCVIKLK